MLEKPYKKITDNGIGNEVGEVVHVPNHIPNPATSLQPMFQQKIKK